MRAIGYFWLKGDEQGSLREYEGAFLEYCSEHRHQPMATFGDTGIAREGDENQYRRMVDYMRTSISEFLVLVPDATHLGGDLEEVARAMVQLDGMGAKVLCTDEEFPDPLQNALQSLGVKGVSRSRSNRIREAMQARAQDGLGLGRPPYGYRIGPEGRLEIVSEEASVVQLIFRLYNTEDLGLRRIVEYLNQRSIPNRQKTGWGIIAIRDILRNMAYLGAYTRFGLRLPKNHPPIIAPQVFQKAQDQMSMRRPRRDKVQIEPFILSGLAYCGYCGNKMIGVTRRQTWRRQDARRVRGVYKYYQCQSRTNRGLCQYHTWRASRLEEAVRSQLHTALEVGRLPPTKATRDLAAQKATARTTEQRFIWAFKKSAQGLLPLALLGQYLDQMDSARRAAGPGGVGDMAEILDIRQLTTEQWDSLAPPVLRIILTGLVHRVMVKDEGIDVQLQSISPPATLSSSN